MEEDLIIETETVETVEVSNVSSGFINWKNLSRYIILGLVFLLPFWVFPWAGFSLGLSKSLLIFTGVLLAAIFYLVHLLQKGSLFYPKSLALLSLGALLLVMLVSSFFSGAISFSFFGAGNGIGSFSFILILSIALFLVVSLFRSEKNVLTFFLLLLVSSGLVFINQVLLSVFGINLGGIFQAKTDSLVGSWSEAGIFFGFIALMTIIFLEFFGDKLIEMPSGRRWQKILILAVGLSLLAMAMVNFTAVWVVFSSLLLVLLVYIFSFFRGIKNFARLPLFIILISLFFILARPLMADLSGAMGLGSLEVRPSWGATIDIVKSTFGDKIKNIIIGSGPNTFIYDWIKFKPVSINQTIFWNIRFNNGIGFLPSFVATVGILGALCLAFFLLTILYYGLKAISYAENDITKSLLISTFLGSVYLWIFNIIYVPSQFLFTLSFLVTGLFIALLVKSGKMKSVEFSFLDRSTVGFISSLAIVLLLIGGVAAFYMLFQKYWAAYSYQQGVAILNTGGDSARAEVYLTKAVSFDPQDTYYRALSQLGIIYLSDLLNQQSQLSQEELSLRFQNITAFAVQNAQLAININPSDPLNWIALGQVYENLSVLKIQGAEEAALQAYQVALEGAPSDPTPLFYSARTESQLSKNDSARSYLSSALSLKSDYTSALFLLANLAAQEGDLDEAIRQTDLARLSAPNDVGVLFQLGLLYYQKKDYNNVTPVLQRVVALSPDYSNARYFLGLSFAKQNDTKSAIEQFERVKELNPDNAEVAKILSNLKAGKAALSGISPSPESRSEPPIEELSN